MLRLAMLAILVVAAISAGASTPDPWWGRRPSAADRACLQRWARAHLAGPAATPPFSFVYGGRLSSQAMPGWRVATTRKKVDGERAMTTRTWTDPATGLQVAWEVTEYPGAASVEWVVRLRNTGDRDTPILEAIQALDATLEAPGTGEIALHHSLGDSNSGDSFRPITDLLPVGKSIALAPNGGRSSDGHMPFFNLQLGNGGVAIAVGWSGQWAASFDRQGSRQVHARAGMQSTHLVLHPGEAIRTPRIFLTLWQGDDPLRGNQLMRQALLRYKTPRRAGQVVYTPICGTVGEVEPDGSYEGPHIRVMKPLAALGVEVFWSDMDPQQWYPGGFPGGTGTWEPDLAKYPRGLKPVGDAACEAGLQYLLWFEPERVAAGTQIAREHPEWVAGGAGGGLFRLDLPDARKWIIDKIDTQVALAQLGWVRWDFNIEPLSYWRSCDAPDRQGITEIRHIEGLYEFWDELARRHPGLLIDICASGGRRLDVETLSRGLPLWHSDLQCTGAHPEDDQLQNAGLYRWLPLHAAGDFGLEPTYSFRSCMTTGNIMCLAAHAPENAEAVRKSIALQKRLRPYVLGDFRPLLPHSGEATGWFGWQFHRADTDTGCLFLFRRAGCADGSKPVSPAGIRSSARYEVHYENTGATETMLGSRLATLAVAVAEAPGSEIVTYRRVGRR